MVEVKLRTFIPSEAINVTAYPSRFVNGADNRAFSSSDDASFRSSQSASLNFGSNGEPLLESSGSEPSDTGTTFQFSKADASGSPLDWRWELDEGAEPVNETQLDPANIAEPEISVEGNAFSVDFELSGTNPLPPPIFLTTPTGPVESPPPSRLVPAFNADLDVLVSQDASGAINYEVDGSHDGFPAYELYIDDTLVYAYDPILAGKSPLALFPPQDVNISEVSGTIPPGTVSAPFPSEPGVAFGTTDGTFDTITPEPSADPLDFVQGEDTNQLNFGVSSNPINSFRFEGEESFQTRPNESFVLGTFTYENGIIPDLNLNDDIYTSDLTISSNSPFSSVTAPFNFNDSFTQEITLNVTSNIAGNPAEENADIISFSNSLGSFHVFEGETATVQLLGSFSSGSLNFSGFGEVLSDPSTGFLEL